MDKYQLEWLGELRGMLGSSKNVHNNFHGQQTVSFLVEETTYCIKLIDEILSREIKIDKANK